MNDQPTNGAAVITAAPQNEPQDLITSSLATFREGGEILRRNQLRVVKADEWADEILAAAEALGGKFDAELDADADEFLSKAAKAAREMENDRMPITRMMTTIRDAYTAAENALRHTTPGTKAAQIQHHRNNFAQEVLAARREEERKERERQEKEQERVLIRTKAETALLDYFSAYLLQEKKTMRGNFDVLTLETIDVAEIDLLNYAPIYPREHYDAWSFVSGSIYLDRNEVQAIAAAVRIDESLDAFRKFGARFVEEVQALKMDLLEELPRKKTSLLEVAAAGAKKRRELQEKIDAEAEENRKKLESQHQEATGAAAEEIQTTGAAHYEAAGATRPAFVGPSRGSIKVAEKLLLTDRGAVPTIFAFWWEREGKGMQLADSVKRTVLQMITYIENLANSGGERLVHPGIEWREDVQAKASVIRSAPAKKTAAPKKSTSKK